jgi:hypothetical protein
MKLSPPTTKTQKPQRYLTLLYRHLALGSISALVSVNILLIAGKACNKLPAFGRLKVYNA